MLLIPYSLSAVNFCGLRKNHIKTILNHRDNPLKKGLEKSATAGSDPLLCPSHEMRTLHASMLSKQPLPLTFLSRLEVRLRGPTSKLITRPSDGEKTNNMSPVDSERERKEDPTSVECLGVSVSAGGGKVEGDRLSSYVREGASMAASKGVPAAARALCEAIVELDGAVEDNNSNSSGRQGQLSALVCLYDRVARGILLHCEGFSSQEDGRGGCGISLEALRKLVEKARGVNGSLFGKRRSLAKLAATRRKVERELQALTEDLQAFARQHKPELAITEDAYVSRRPFSACFAPSCVSCPAHDMCIPSCLTQQPTTTTVARSMCEPGTAVICCRDATAPFVLDPNRFACCLGPRVYGKSLLRFLLVRRGAHTCTHFTF